MVINCSAIFDAYTGLRPFQVLSFVLCWFIAWHAFRSLLFFGFAMWVTSSVKPPLLILGILAYPWTQFPVPCMTALSLKRCRHKQALSWLPHKMCLIPCAGKLDHRFAFDWLTSCPDYNPALNCVGSSRRFSSHDLQDGTCHSFLEWQENRL
jgi:hypothetical protein